LIKVRRINSGKGMIIIIPFPVKKITRNENE